MRCLAAFAVLTLFIPSVLGDGGPPPAPKGKKYVGAEVSVAIDKNVTGYVFVLSEAEGGQQGRPQLMYSSVTLGEKPTKVGETSGERRVKKKFVVGLLAIPAETAKKYATEKELSDAIDASAVQGVQLLRFIHSDTIAADDKRETIPWKYTVTSIDSKNGITATKERDGKPVETKKRFENPNGNESDEPLANSTGNRRTFVAALFLTAAFVGLGLWLVARRRVS